MAEKHYELKWNFSAKLRKDKALAFIAVVSETIAKFPEDTMFNLKFQVDELIKEKKQKIV